MKHFFILLQDIPYHKILFMICLIQKWILENVPQRTFIYSKYNAFFKIRTKDRKKNQITWATPFVYNCCYEGTFDSMIPARWDRNGGVSDCGG